MSFNIIRLFIVYSKFIDKTDFTLKHYNFLSIRKLVPFLEKSAFKLLWKKYDTIYSFNSSVGFSTLKCCPPHASCLWINVAVVEFFYKFAHIVTSFNFLP